MVTGTNTINPRRFIYPILKGELTLSIIFPPVIIVIVPLIAIKNPIAAAVPIDFLISYPKVLINGTISEPPPIPSGTDINPIKIPEIFFTKLEIFLGLSTSFSLKKIKNKPTKKANIEKNNINDGVLRLTARKVEQITFRFLNHGQGF